MLKRFRVSNFKSLVDVEFLPAGLNLLVGPNNSGKTNLCQALRFVSATARMSLAEAATHAAGGPWNLLHAYAEKRVVGFALECVLPHPQHRVDLTFDYSLLLREEEPGPPSHGRRLIVDKEELWVSGLLERRVGLLLGTEGSIDALRE